MPAARYWFELGGMASPMPMRRGGYDVTGLSPGMTLSRYLLRETGLAWLAVVTVLLFIMVATRFASVLNFAAKGVIPADLLLRVAMLSSLRYLMILMPVSFLLAVMLALGRLYSDNEIAAMGGCGVSLARLYRPVLLLALLLASITAVLSFQIGPWAGRRADYLVKHSRKLLQMAPFDPGKFQPVGGGRAVFYTASADGNGGHFGAVFAQIAERNRGESTVVAQEGTQGLDPTTGARIVTLKNGYRYSGVLGESDVDVAHFKALQLRLKPPPFHYVNNQLQLESTPRLLAGDSPASQAELQARIAAPLSVLVLALLALPLSHLRPRQGRYSKIVLGILAYLVYANLIGFGQIWLAQGRLPPWVGLWWVHGLALLMTLMLYAHGQRRRWRTGW